jgi:hypothetical protein
VASSTAVAFATVAALGLLASVATSENTRLVLALLAVTMVVSV